MTHDRLALFILTALVVVLNGAFAWYAIGNDAEVKRLRDRTTKVERDLYLLAAKVEHLENPDSPLPSDPVTYVASRYPKRPDEV